jgi:hypothetical protein
MISYGTLVQLDQRVVFSQFSTIADDYSNSFTNTAKATSLQSEGGEKWKV